MREGLGAAFVHDDDAAIFDEVQSDNGVIGFYLLVKVAATQAMIDPRLTKAAISTLGVILSLLDIQTRTAWPSYELIARSTDLSESSVRKAISELRRLGYLVTRRAAPPSGGHWLCQYGIGPVVNPRVIDNQIASALAMLRGRQIEGVPYVAFRSQVRQIERSWIDPTAAGKAQLESKCAQERAVGSRLNRADISAVEKPSGPKTAQLATPTAQIGAHSIDLPIDREDAHSRQPQPSNLARLEGRPTSAQAEPWLSVTVQGVRAILPGKKGDVVRTVPASSIRKLAECLGVGADAAAELIGEEFSAWHNSGFAGGHRNWEWQLLDAVRRRHALSPSGIVPNIAADQIPSIHDGGWED